MPDIAAQSFSIKSLLSRPAADFDADVPGSAEFIAASEADRVTLEAGYQDVTGTPTFISQVTKGIVDEWELTLSPAVIASRVRGRDPLTLLLERPVMMVFPRSPERAVVETVATLAEGGGNYRVVNPDHSPLGRWTARTIAEAVIARLNEDLAPTEQLVLSWQVRDYEIRSDYSASGRPVDILGELAEPWNQVPAMAVDVLIEGLVVIIRNRQPVPPAEYTFALADARIKRLTITKRRPRRTGQVTLSGMSVQIEGNGRVGLELPDPTIDIEETPNRTSATVTTPTGTFTYRMPEGLLIRSVKVVFGASPLGGEEMISRETTENDWTAVQYDNMRPLNAANQISQRVVIEGIHPSDPSRTFQVLRTEDVTFEYDTQEFLYRTTSTKRELNLRARDMRMTERVTKDYDETGPLRYEIVTTTARWNDRIGFWTLISRDGAPASGYRPGGPGRSKVTWIPGGLKPGLNNSGTLIPVMIQETISEAPDAEPFIYSNDNLTLEELRAIFNQIAQASGLWEYELSIECITMPWLRKHVGIQFTGARDADGTLIPFHPDLPPGYLRPALIVEHQLRYVEGDGPDASSLTSMVRALYWSAT
jgi:hypothetical protein